MEGRKRRLATCPLAAESCRRDKDKIGAIAPATPWPGRRLLSVLLPPSAWPPHADSNSDSGLGLGLGPQVPRERRAGRPKAHVMSLPGGQHGGPSPLRRRSVAIPPRVRQAPRAATGPPDVPADLPDGAALPWASQCRSPMAAQPTGHGPRATGRRREGASRLPSPPHASISRRATANGGVAAVLLPCCCRVAAVSLPCRCRLVVLSMLAACPPSASALQTDGCNGAACAN